MILDANQVLAVWKGWGTSLAWWGNAVGRWSDPSRQAVFQALFSRQGLGLNLLRYNIGGGENPNHHHMRLYADVPGWVDADGVWQPDADSAQVTVLKESMALGVDTVEAFSNAPPYWMTRHDCAAGSPDGSANLADDKLEAFADYLVAVVVHFRDRVGIRFHSLSPVNEPLSWWWKAGNNQEGCRFEVDQQKVLLGLLRSKLDAVGLGALLLSGPEENNLDQSVETLDSLGEATLGRMGQLNVHSYQGSRRAELADRAQRLGLPLWMSEVTVGGTEAHDHQDWTSAVELGQKVCADVNGLACEAWVYWQAVEDEAGGHNHGLVHADFRGSEAWFLTRQYHVMAQFSRFIRPGARILAGMAENTVAAWHPDGTVVLVAVNPTAQPYDLTPEGPLAPGAGSTIRAWRTSKTLLVEPCDPRLSCAPESVTTWQWRTRERWRA